MKFSIFLFLFLFLFIGIGQSTIIEDGKNYFSQGQYEKARTIFEKIIQEGATNSAEAQFLIGKIYYYQNYFSPAVKNFRKMISDYTNSEYKTKSLLWIGSSYFYLKKDYLKAILNYQKVLENYRFTDEGFTAYLQIGHAYLKLNKKIEAKNIF